MTSILEKGGGTFTGIKLLLCENPLPPIDAAIAAAQAEVPHSNYYTELYSALLRRCPDTRFLVDEAFILAGQAEHSGAAPKRSASWTRLHACDHRAARGQRAFCGDPEGIDLNSLREESRWIRCCCGSSAAGC
jgi:histidinol-phosphate/aromatic aminotransferase/cobyric acid decarboxylase-like protein